MGATDNGESYVAGYTRPSYYGKWRLVTDECYECLVWAIWSDCYYTTFWIRLNICFDWAYLIQRDCSQIKFNLISLELDFAYFVLIWDDHKKTIILRKTQIGFEFKEFFAQNK